MNADEFLGRGRSSSDEALLSGMPTMDGSHQNDAIATGRVGSVEMGPKGWPSPAMRTPSVEPVVVHPAPSRGGLTPKRGLTPKKVIKKHVQPTLTGSGEGYVLQISAQESLLPVGEELLIMVNVQAPPGDVRVRGIVLVDDEMVEQFDVPVTFEKGDEEKEVEVGVMMDRSGPGLIRAMVADSEGTVQIQEQADFAVLD